MESALTARDRVGVQDFVLLENFTSEAAFIENLRRRFRENLIYVRTMSSAGPTDLGEGGTRNLQEKPLTLLLCPLRPTSALSWSLSIPTETYRSTAGSIWNATVVSVSMKCRLICLQWLTLYTGHFVLSVGTRR